MNVACLGLGRMGEALAERLLAGSHDVCGFDVAQEARARFVDAGGRAAEDPATATDGADAVVLCLPDAHVVEDVVLAALGAEQPVPALWIDCTSSLPAVTRELGERVHDRGAVLVDAPVTGGVAGARAGELTAMVGGEEADLERARPLLECFAARVMPAGRLGSGHAVKALNNALSSAALLGTAEITTVGTILGLPLEATIEHINAGLARSQNSEVKYVSDVLPGRYASGFITGLMAKDVATACALTRDVPVPLTALQRALWRVAITELGPDSDFTRVHELAGRWSLRQAGPFTDHPLSQLSDALAGVLAITAREILTVADALELDRSAALAIINAGSGRSEFTRLAETQGAEAGVTIADAQQALDELLTGADVAAPLSRLAAEELRAAARELGADLDLAVLVTT